MARREARSYLKANGVGAAAHSLWRLNRIAKNIDPDYAKRIYWFKNQLIKFWYMNGFCRKVSLDIQKLKCWRCDGTGEHWMTGEDCWKCRGSGVFRTVYLYQFVFNFDGRRYIWHQPKDLVDWGVSWEVGPLGDYGYRTPIWTRLSSEHEDVLVATLYEYLLAQDQDVEEMKKRLSWDQRRPLQTALKWDLWNRNPLRRKWQAFRERKEVPF